ncbi:glycosyltransferase [Macrococcus brunensis]|uniref:glycosyltransferase n=1 Tax=Macrococcus brunensis TaxID=198483 RepID=UPI001EEFA05F|nr:glycosyltransferase [Macrococcus brunensis]ULG72684.1 glycosyltransferase [Macrococcus brunensis]
MVFSREHNFQDKIVKRILNPDEVLETTEEQGAKSRNDVSTPVDYDVLETERKIERYQQYQDVLSRDYQLALSLLGNMKENESFVDFLEKWQREGKTDFFSKLEPYLATLPESNGSRVFNKIKKRVGIICDEFLYNSYKDVVDLVYIPHDYEDIDLNFDFVIVATAWTGIEKSWSGLASLNGAVRQRAIELISLLKAKQIPVIFYSKEDPVNYDVFKDLATHCDYIYTSAIEIEDTYREYTENDNVSTLSFGINPHYHNPVGTRTDLSRRYKDEIIFAGSWMVRYPQRNKEAARIFDAIIKNDTELTIIDRNLELQRSRYYFPLRYIPNVTGPLSHGNLQKIHKIFRWAINVNSVKYSDTMYANRIYELQAFGNLLLSNYSVGVNNKFPNVFILNHQTDFKTIFNNLSEDDLKSIQAKGIRNVMRSETTYHRMLQIMNDIGIDYTDTFEHEVYVVVPEITDSIQKQFDAQSYGNKHLMTERDFKEANLTEGFVTYFKNDYYYEEYYLEDLYSAFKYTDVDFVTKSDNESEHHNYTNTQNDGLTMYDISTMKQSDLKGYALDRVEVTTPQTLATKPINRNKKLSVIIPIHNNGTYLEDKCMSSLKRSSMYDDMEIIFVNDGSTDELTIQIINRLRRQNPSIVYYEFESGSGSASRPRNKGAELASTDFITYLDPDNEAIGDGYKYLYDKLQENPDLDMVVGNILKEDNKKRSEFNFYVTGTKYNNGEALITDPHAFMERCGLRAQSIQALVVKSDIIKKNNLRMVEGAAGQDTMFFQELVLNSRQVLLVKEYIHMYYAAVSGSVTNTISKKFFDKYYKLETERIPFLLDNKLMDTYMEKRFNFYVKGWYIVRLDRINPEEREEALTRFLDIYSLYDEYDRPEDKDLNDVIKSLKEEVNYHK